MGKYCFFIAASWGQGAIPEHFQALAHHLVERGHCVFYLPHGKQWSAKPLAIDDGNFHVRSFPSPRPTRPRDFLFLYRLIREYHPDCLIANFGAGNVMTLVGWLTRVPNRVDWYHTLSTQVLADSPYSPWKNWLLLKRKQFVYRFATQIIANSVAAVEDVQHVYRIPAHKCHVFYYTLADPLPNLSPCQPDGRPSILCAGRLWPTKGQDTLIRAMALLKNSVPDAKVEFVGDGPQRETYQRLAQELGVADRCTFAGNVPHDEVLARMAAATVCVVPSRSEAFGIVNIESMAVGTPVVASQVGGIVEIIRDGQDGFLVPPDDPQALANRLYLILSDPALRAQMGQNARQHFLDRFEQRANIVKQADWFEALVANVRG